PVDTRPLRDGPRDQVGLDGGLQRQAADAAGVLAERDDLQAAVERGVVAAAEAQQRERVEVERDGDRDARGGRSRRRALVARRQILKATAHADAPTIAPSSSRLRFDHWSFNKAISPGVRFPRSLSFAMSSPAWPRSSRPGASAMSCATTAYTSPVSTAAGDGTAGLMCGQPPRTRFFRSAHSAAVRSLNVASGCPTCSTASRRRSSRSLMPTFSNSITRFVIWPLSWSSECRSVFAHKSSATPKRIAALRIASPMASFTPFGPGLPSADPYPSRVTPA